MNEKPMCFVFGSNLAGAHGAGAAKTAWRSHAAKLGVGFGYCYDTVREGSPMKHSFAIPTKDFWVETLPLHTVQSFVDGFLAFAAAMPEIAFKVTQIGCGLAGLKVEDIAPMFLGGQENIYYDEAWKEFLLEGSKFWGTYKQV